MGNKIWVYAAGVFDLLHPGHVRYLQRAKDLGDFLVVGLVTDEGVERYKFHKPILTYKERWEVVRALRCVDFVVRQEDTDPTETLRVLKDDHKWIFDIMVRGNDYKGVPPGSDFIKQNGGKVIRLPYSKDISSTNIKLRIYSHE